MWECKACLKVDRDYKKHHCPLITAGLDAQKLCDPQAEALTKQSTTEGFNSDMASEIGNRNNHFRHENREELEMIDEKAQGNDGDEAF